jgi:hypothetical protein
VTQDFAGNKEEINNRQTTEIEGGRVKTNGGRAGLAVENEMDRKVKKEKARELRMDGESDGGGQEFRLDVI